MPRLKVVAVNKSIVYRTILQAAIETTGLAKLIKVTPSNELAIERIKNQEYDIAILSSEDNGIFYLKKVKKEYPKVKVIMFGSNDNNDLLNYLEFGAIDYLIQPDIDKPEKSIHILKAQMAVIFNKTNINFDISEGKVSLDERFKDIILRKTKEYDEMKSKKRTTTRIRKIDLILIASSTGGPKALNVLFRGLKKVKKPILVVQHMPKGFTSDFAKDLNNKLGFNVLEGENGHILENDEIIIAPGDFHMLLKKKSFGKKEIYIEKTETVNNVRPAADVLFKSVAESFPGIGILAIVLTGMGKDGRDGINELKQRCKCYCITQSKNSCVVYGMPKAVYDSDLSDEVVHIESMGERINQLIERGNYKL